MIKVNFRSASSKWLNKQSLITSELFLKMDPYFTTHHSEFQGTEESIMKIK